MIYHKLIGINNLHQTTKNIIDILEEVTRKHVPINIKDVSRNRKQFDKPWITDCILKSIKRQPKGQLSPLRLIRNRNIWTDKSDIL